MSAEKTEQPTAKRLRDSRQKGQVAKSQDVTTGFLMAATFATVAVSWEWFLRETKELMLLPTAFYTQPFPQAFEAVAYGVLVKAVVLSLPVVLVGFLAGFAASFAQVGPLLSFEPIKPELKKLNPLEKAKQIFSGKNFIEFGKSALKVAAIGVIVTMIVRSSIDGLSRLPYGGEAALLASIAPLMKSLAINVTLCYVAIAGFDYFFQRYQHVKQLKMSKDEVKREYKESEGDPQIKGKRKQLHQELMANNQVQRTRKATVVVTNPTHLAVAIYYEEKDNVLPTVLAKGEDHVARRMIEVAREEGIPVMQNIPLARALYAEVPVDRYIPSDLIEPMAEVLRWVKEYKEQRGYTS
jgi:type III secretion protein U